MTVNQEFLSIVDRLRAVALKVASGEKPTDEDIVEARNAVNDHDTHVRSYSELYDDDESEEP